MIKPDLTIRRHLS